MRYLCLLISLSLIVTSCKQKTTNSRSSFQTKRFISDDRKFDHRGYLNPDSLILVNPKSEINIVLKRIRSGSGAKYSNSDSIVLWIKGEEFMYLVNDSITARGKVSKSN